MIGKDEETRRTLMAAGAILDCLFQAKGITFLVVVLDQDGEAGMTHNICCRHHVREAVIRLLHLYEQCPDEVESVPDTCGPVH